MVWGVAPQRILKFLAFRKGSFYSGRVSKKPEIANALIESSFWFIEDRFVSGQVCLLSFCIRYIRETRTTPLTLEVDTPVKVIAYIDASYAVHADKKSHTCCIITLGKGAIYGKSSTQKLNTTSSTEAELVAMTEAGNQVLWTRNFLIHQEYEVGPVLIYQDNLSTIQLVKNGRSNNERTRHIDIKFFFLHDRIKADHIIVICKITKEMIADLLTKPLQEKLFQELRDQVLNV